LSIVAETAIVATGEGKPLLQKGGALWPEVEQGATSCAPGGKGRTSMPKGTVKWFNPTKGYGFIAPESGGKDIFVHISAVQKAGLRTLNEGQKVGFDVEQQQNGRTAAINLQQSE